MAWDLSIYPQHLYHKQLGPVLRNSLWDSKQLHTMGELHPASLNCPTLSKLPKKNCKTSLLLCKYIILSWWCNVTGLARQPTGLFAGPVQLIKLATSYAQFSVHSFLPLVLSWDCELSRPTEGVYWMPELAQGKLTWKPQSEAELGSGNSIFFPFWNRQQ